MSEKTMTIGYDEYQHLLNENNKLRKAAKELKAKVKAGETVLILESKAEQIMGTFTLLSGEEANKAMAEEYKNRGNAVKTIEPLVHLLEKNIKENESLKYNRRNDNRVIKELYDRIAAARAVMSKKQLRKAGF